MTTLSKKEKEWSYDLAVPPPRQDSILGPLRRREYQTRQQQLRTKTTRRTGNSFRLQDHPQSSRQRIPVESSNNGSSNGSDMHIKTVSFKGSEPSVKKISVHHPLAPLTPLASHEGDVGEPSSSTTDRIAMPSRSASSFSGLQSNPTPLTTSSGNKCLMSNEQAMEFDSLETSTGSSYPSSLSRGLRGPRFMSAQLGFNERRMSTPSISTTPKQSSQPRFDDARSSSTSSSPSASSLSLPSTSSQCRNTSTSQRLSSLYSVARTWISTSPSIFDRGESNGHSNIDQPERSSSTTDDDCSSYKPDAIARYISATIPNIISEREYCVDKYDKIFAGTWVTNEEVLFGTKCNKVVLLNTETGRQLSIPRLDECLLENVDDALSRVRETASSAQSSNTSQILSGSSTAAYKHPLGNATVNNISNDFSGLDFATRFTERNLHFNLGRRSSTPSFFSEPSPGHINMYSSTRSPPAVSTTNTTATQELAASTGIRSIAINPSRTLLAIGSGEPFQVTIYSLPELAPVGMMYGHKGLVFALTWVSDTVLVTGGRDGSMRVWSMASPALTVIPSVRHEIQVRLPEITRAERNTRVRDLAFNKGSEQTMTLHTDGYVKLWDRNSYAELHRLPLKYTVEAVCLTSSVESNLFVVGSQSHLCILDPRASKIVHEAESCDEGCGIRSLDFKSHIITIGDGYGRIGFYDVRAKAYLNVFDDGKTKRRHHEIGPGSLDQDTVYAGNVAGMTIRSAVYAMEYDSSGTRLFAAGGPIQVGLSGAYAGLWS